jgi:hypothetical protein
MKRTSALAIAAGLCLMGCGADDSVSPTPDAAAQWVGDYTGTAFYRLPNGSTGQSEAGKATLSIKAVDPKRISLVAQVTYLPVGSTREAVASATGIVVSPPADSLQSESRSGSSRNEFVITKNGAELTADIVTSERNFDGGWNLTQRLVMTLTRK